MSTLTKMTFYGMFRHTNAKYQRKAIVSKHVHHNILTQLELYNFTIMCYQIEFNY